MVLSVVGVKRYMVVYLEVPLVGRVGWYTVYGTP